MLDFSVVIPTFNGGLGLPIVLEYLKHQINIENISWEVIVVNNNSQDDIDRIVRNFRRNWPIEVSLKYLFEARQGVSFSRGSGVEAATGELVGFLDDDNLPAPNWVFEVIQFALNHPKAGAYNGIIEGIFEGALDTDLKPLLGFLAVRDYGSCPRLFQPHKLQLPPGAGLVVRRRAWLKAIPNQLVCTSGGGDDYEVSFRLAKHGWEIWYNPLMHIQHVLPPHRLTREYLRNLAHSYGLCTCKLIMIDTPPWQQPLLLIKCFLGSIKRIFYHCLRYRSKLRHTIEADCKLAFYYGNLKSPFFYILNLK